MECTRGPKHIYLSEEANNDGAEGWAISAFSRLTTRGQCWPQTAWLCWKHVRGSQEAEDERTLSNDVYLT